MKDRQGKTIDGIELEHGDVYFYCNWLDYAETTISGGRKYVVCDQEAPELVHLAGAVIPHKVGVMKEGAKRLTISRAKHSAVLARCATPTNG